MPSEANGSGGNGSGLLAHHLQLGALGLRAVEQVEHHLGAEAGGADAEPGVARRRRRRRPPRAVP